MSLAILLGELKTIRRNRLQRIAIAREKRVVQMHCIYWVFGTFMGSLALLHVIGHTVTGSDQNVYPPMSTQLEMQARIDARLRSRSSTATSRFSHRRQCHEAWD